MVFNLPCEATEVKKKFPAMREAAKAITFGILFGSGAAKVAESVNDALFEQHLETGEEYNPIGVAEAREYIADYFKRFPELKKWIDKSHRQILEDGYIYSHFGRKRRLRNIKSSDRGLVGEELRSGL